MQLYNMRHNNARYGVVAVITVDNGNNSNLARELMGQQGYLSKNYDCTAIYSEDDNNIDVVLANLRQQALENNTPFTLIDEREITAPEKVYIGDVNKGILAALNTSIRGFGGMPASHFQRVYDFIKETEGKRRVDATKLVRTLSQEKHFTHEVQTAINTLTSAGIPFEINRSRLPCAGLKEAMDFVKLIEMAQVCGLNSNELCNLKDS